MFTETQRKRRGHNFLPPKSVKVPGLYETDSIKAEDKIIPLKYFSAAGDWYIAEADFETGEAFGYVILGGMPEGQEWGYIDLHELEELNLYRGLVIVERDKFWSPKRFGDIEKTSTGIKVDHL